MALALSSTGGSKKDCCCSAIYWWNKRLSAEGIGMLVVEQKLSVAASLADHVLIMVKGRIALGTTAPALLVDEEAQRRYLGIT